MRTTDGKNPAKRRSRRRGASLPIVIMLIVGGGGTGCSDSPQIASQVDQNAIKNTKEASTVAADAAECTEVGQTGCVLTEKFKEAGETTDTSATVDTDAAVSYAPCDADGAVDCLTTGEFRAMDMSKINAADIKNGVSIAGVVGAYPSVKSPLQSSTGVADLTSFGPTTEVGTYQFFDSQGAVYLATIADAGTITPKATDQTLGKANTMYRAALVRGDESLIPERILKDVILFGVKGIVPAGSSASLSACSTSKMQDCLVADTGTLYAATRCGQNESSCYLPAYAAASQSLKAMSYDVIDAGKGAIRSSLVLGGISGTLADCSANGEANCFITATGAYQAGDLSQLTAGNIKKGAIVAGVTGTYPSIATPLANNTAVPDLTSFGLSTPLGTYEFFDSAGAVYSATVLDGGQKTPTTANQVLSTAGSLYRSVTVVGDPDLVAENIKSGTTVFGVDGTILGAPANCTFAGQQNCLVAGPWYSGQKCSSGGFGCYLPAYTGTQPLKAINYDNIKAGKASIKTSLVIVAGDTDIAGTLADCSGNSQTNCVTSDTYKSADLTNLTAANVKNGVTISGVPGTYPSVATPLANNTVTPDLPASLGSATPLGTYEFFDSAGNVYSAIVADTGTGVTPTTATQNLNAVHTMYRKIDVLGDPDLILTNIANNVPIFSVTGNMVKAPDPCTASVTRGCLVAGSYYAAISCTGNDSSCYMPTYDGATNHFKAIDYTTIVAGQASIRTSATIGGVTGTLADCNAVRQSGCVADGTSYKTADFTNLTAANIKKDVTISGVVGTYPSASTPLASNTATTDLTSFDPSMSTGTYEFFDSTGAVHTAIIADGGTLTPSTSARTLNTANTMYRSVTVRGDANLVVGNILKDAVLFGVTGTVVASPANCATSGSQECVATGSYFAAHTCSSNDSKCYVPSYVATTKPLKAINYDTIDASKMRSSLTIADKTGTIQDCTDGGYGCNVTSSFKAVTSSAVVAGKIYTGTVIASVSGTLTLPPENRVLTGTSFGPSSSPLSGTLTLPSAVNVVTSNGTYGDSAAPLTPSLVLPAITKVLNTIQYGTNGNGSTGNLTLPSSANVVINSDDYGDPTAPSIPSYVVSSPGTPPDAPTISSVQFDFNPDKITITWGAVSGAYGYLVLMNDSQAVTFDPVDGVTYPTGSRDADTVTYAGSATTMTYSATITQGKTYHFALYSYNSKTTYSTTATTRLLPTCSVLTGGTWIPVPSDSTYKTSGFCVMKYIPSKVSNVATSQAGTSPWDAINQVDAKTACSALGSGYHLITNNEWMAIGVNIVNVPSNWSGNSVGSGNLSRGHSDGSPSISCKADSNDNNAWLNGTGTDCTASTQGSGNLNQRRTQTIAVGSIIWDFAGNVNQWVDYTTTGKPSPNQNSYYEYTSGSLSYTTTLKSDLVPTIAVTNSWNSSKNIGMLFPGSTTNGPTYALNRGGQWDNTNSGIFTASFYDKPTLDMSSQAAWTKNYSFRCAWTPP